MSLCALVVAARTAAMDAVFQYLTARTDPQSSICLWLRLQAHNSLNHTATHALIAYTHSVLCIAGAAQQCCYLRVFFLFVAPQSRTATFVPGCFTPAVHCEASVAAVAAVEGCLLHSFGTPNAHSLERRARQGWCVNCSMLRISRVAWCL